MPPHTPSPSNKPALSPSEEAVPVLPMSPLQTLIAKHQGEWSVDVAMLLPLLAAQEGTETTPDEIRQARIQIYRDILGRPPVTSAGTSVPIWDEPFAIRSRVEASIGLLAEIAAFGDAGTINPENPAFRDALLCLERELNLLKASCERFAAHALSPEEATFYTDTYRSLSSIADKYRDPSRSVDFDLTLFELPPCINKETLGDYVSDLRKIGCDRAKGWYVDSHGTRHELFSYSRVDDSVVICMRSSGKAVTGLVTVRFLDEYRKQMPGQSPTLGELLNTPVLSLCTDLKAEVKKRHAFPSEHWTRWNQITFRDLINNTAGLPTRGDVAPALAFDEALKCEPEPVGEAFVYANQGFDIVYIALQEIITKHPGRFLGANSLQDFIRSVMRVGDVEWLTPTHLIPPTPICPIPTPHGRGLASSTLTSWSNLPEVLKQQSPEVLSELLNPFPGDVKPVNFNGYGGGFWFHSTGLLTLGYKGNFSYIIPERTRREGENHAEWMTSALSEGYIVIVQQADVAHIAADVPAAELNFRAPHFKNLFQEGSRDPSSAD